MENLITPGEFQRSSQRTGHDDRATPSDEPLELTLPVPIHDDTEVSYVAMGAVNATTGSVDSVERRRYHDTSPGLTPFVSGDVLVAKITPCFQNGKIAQALLPTEIGMGSTEFHVVRPREGCTDARYLMHFLRQGWVQSAGQQRMTGSGGQRRVPAMFFQKLQLDLPPIEEQRRIAAVLDEADELRAKRRAMQETLDTLTESVFIEMFDLEMSQHSDGQWITLNEIIDPKRPVCYGILKPGPDITGGKPYVRVVDMRDGGIAYLGVRRTSPEISHQYRRSLLRAGDLLMSIRGHVGRLAEVPPQLEAANITQDSARIAVVDAEPLYILEYLRLTRTQAWMARNTKGIAVRGINIGDVRRIPIMLPSPDRQRDFVRTRRRIEENRTAVQMSLSGHDDLFASLQQRAFRGDARLRTASRQRVAW